MDLDNSNMFGYREWQEPIDNIELKENIKYEVSEEDKEENIDNFKFNLVWDDEECKYKINMYSYVDIGRNDVFDFINRQIRVGERIKPLKFYVDDIYNAEHYEFENCYLGDSCIKIKDYYGIEKREKCTELKCYRIVKECMGYNCDSVKTLTEWYLNGPKDINWTRMTERRIKTNYTVICGHGKAKNIDREWNSSSWDSSIISLKDFSFIIKEIPKDFGPNWSNNLAIEYSEELGGIPNPEVRKSISSIISYIFGKQLINIGYSEFDDKENLMKEVYINSVPSDIKKLCGTYSVSPVRQLQLHYQDEKENYLEVIIGELVEKYLNFKDTYELDRIMNIYWLAKRQPLGYETPLLANCIESLSKKWFKTTKTKTSGVYMKKKDFEKLLGEYFEGIKEKLGDNEYSNNILNRINNCYNMGVNERLEVFLREIELPISDGERNAIKFRNKMVHESISYENVEELINLSKSYEVFFNRIFLKIIGYTGRYIDFTQYNENGYYIEKEIEIPLGRQCNFRE